MFLFQTTSNDQLTTTMFKGTTKLISKKEIVDNIYEFKYEFPEQIDFVPGRFVNISVTPPYRRPYSILDVEGNIVTYMIDLRSPGKGADYFRESTVGDETVQFGPLGKFSLSQHQNDKVFIATATGVAPFIPMIKKLKSENFSGSIKLFFGIRNLKHDALVMDYLEDLISENFIEYIRCVSQPENESLEYSPGRVTQIVPEYPFDWQNTEFYVCGSNDMIKEMRNTLILKGVGKIFVENYG